MTKFFKIFCLVALLMLGATQAWGATYYVRATVGVANYLKAGNMVAARFGINSDFTDYAQTVTVETQVESTAAAPQAFLFINFTTKNSDYTLDHINRWTKPDSSDAQTVKLTELNNQRVDIITLTSTDSVHPQELHYGLYYSSSNPNDAFYFRATANSSDGEAGTVALRFDSKVPTDADYAASVSKDTKTAVLQQAGHVGAWLYARPNDGYVFVNWKRWTYTDKSDLMVMTEHSYLQDALNSSSSDKNNPQAYYYEATFAKAGAVTVMSADETVGLATIDKPTNAIGDTVTITAKSDGDGLFSTFDYWENGQEERFYTPQLTFKVSNANRGRYTAHFKKFDLQNTGRYCVIYNLNGDGYRLGLLGIADSTNYNYRYTNNAIMLHQGEMAQASPAFVIKVTGTSDGAGGLTDGNLISQGTSSQGVTSFSFDIYKRSDHYEIRGSVAGMNGYMVDYRDCRETIERLGQVRIPSIWNQGAGAEYDKQFWWKIVPLTEAERTYCFGAKPDAGTTHGGKYWTTMYAKFPFRCLDGVQAYTVTAVDNDKHQVHLQLIEGGEVPSGTAVVLRCNSLKPSENRLLPIYTEPTLSQTNLLKGEIWLKTMNHNQATFRHPFEQSHMLLLGQNQFDFSNVARVDVLNDFSKDATVKTGEVTFLPNNMGYLDLGDVTLDDSTHYDIVIEGEEQEPKTLAQVVTENNVGDDVVIVDNDITCVYATSTVLYGKDDNKYATPDAPAEGERDYMGYHGFGKANTYDQSNWVRIELPQEISADAVTSYVGKHLVDVRGKVSSLLNPTIQATANPGMGTENTSYKIGAKDDDRTDNVNTFIAATFGGRTQVDEFGKTQWFMQPKPLEMADIAWAQWGGENFQTPAATASINQGGLGGGFSIDLSDNSGITSSSALSGYENGDLFTFRAIIWRVGTEPVNGAPRRVASNDPNASYMVHPLDLSAQNSVITAVTDVQAARTVQQVTYVNPAGQQSARPFQGVNIMVTRYSDGTTVVKKQIFTP